MDGFHMYTVYLWGNKYRVSVKCDWKLKCYIVFTSMCISMQTLDGEVCLGKFFADVMFILPQKSRRCIL